MADRDLSGLDLSGWRDSMCGSEMIRADTMRSFAETFAPAGLRPEQLRPCYGLAETTLSVSFDRRLEGIRTKPVPLGTFDGGLQEVVSNGTAVIDTEIQVRTPAGGQRPASEVGEVWVRGPGLFSGYYNDPDATAEVLRDGWFDTGDLGFLDQDGELYLTGRSKEILILQGTNIMPHDLEWVAEGVAGSGGSQRAGAFSVPCSAGEQAVLVLETTGKKHFDAALRGNIARAIGRELSIPLADVVLVKRGSLPRTSSGKVQRRELRNRYLRGEIERLGDDQAS